MTDTGFATLPVARIVDARDEALRLLEVYEAAGGLSPDEWDGRHRLHPMAEAKYLLTCAELHDAGVLSTRAARRKVGPSMDRIAEHAVQPAAGMRAWGLGFSYRDLPADEPYVVTTALVLQALLRVRPLLADRLGAPSGVPHAEAVAWLLDGVPRIEVDGAPFPRYSPGLPQAPYNVAAVWAGALATALGPGHARAPEVAEVARAVVRARVAGVGWVYESGSARVDLLHTCYVAVGLRQVLPPDDDLDRVLLAAALEFATGPAWSDVFDVYRLDGAEVARRMGRRPARIVGAHLLAGFDRPARPWSLGELLVLLSGLASSPVVGAVSAQVLRAALPHAMESARSTVEQRHAMHLAHGLAAAFRLLRAQSSREAS